MHGNKESYADSLAECVQYNGSFRQLGWGCMYGNKESYTDSLAGCA